MPKGTPRDPVPVNLTGPKEYSKWIDKDGNIVSIERRVSFHHTKLSNGKLIPLEEFYKHYSPYEEEK